MNLQDDVKAFHKKFGHPAPAEPVGSVGELEFRVTLIEEECAELVEAIRSRNMAKIASESVDVIYVVIGTLVALGIPLLPFWRDVQQANMEKVVNPTGGKPLKPEGWQAPEPERVLYEIRRNLR